MFHLPVVGMEGRPDREFGQTRKTGWPGLEGVGNDLIDRKNDRSRLKSMKTSTTEEKAAF
jgi:hypothetical protein